MQTFILLFGDLGAFYLALFVALSLRAGDVVSTGFYNAHIGPFFVLFLALAFILFIVGAYERDFQQRTSSIFNTVLLTVLALAVVAVTYFYFVPLNDLTPKTNLIFFIPVLFALLFFFRLHIPRFFHFAKPRALLIDGGKRPWAFDVVETLTSDSSIEVIEAAIERHAVRRVLMSFSDKRTRELLPQLHTLMLTGVVFIDIDPLLEEERGTVDLTVVNEVWLLKHIHKIDRKVFLLIKRCFDIMAALVLLVVCIILWPFVALAIKLQNLFDGTDGPVFITQERLGINRQPIYIYKFRTMRCNDDGAWHNGDTNVVTRIGAFLRRSRIDELPQAWSILLGDLSFVGPRPDMVKLGRTLASEIEYYNIRYVVRPGLTGWAQVTQEVIPQSVEESRERLAYDLYYIKRLSLFLELKIMLKTTKLLLTKIFVRSD